MPAIAVNQKPIASIVVPIATLAVGGIAITSRVVADNPLALPRDAAAFLADLGGGINPAVAAVVAVVLFVAGVVSGLSGFAFSAIAACILWLLPPLQAVPLIMLLSVCNQLLSVGQLRKEMVLRGTAEREGALAYIAGGVIGVPIGLTLLHSLPDPGLRQWARPLSHHLQCVRSAETRKPGDQALGLAARDRSGRRRRYRRWVLCFSRLDAGGLSRAARL
jgi:sulfite exporter TauE/SafE